MTINTDDTEVVKLPSPVISRLGIPLQQQMRTPGRMVWRVQNERSRNYEVGTPDATQPFTGRGKCLLPAYSEERPLLAGGHLRQGAQSDC